MIALHTDTVTTRVASDEQQHKQPQITAVSNFLFRQYPPFLKRKMLKGQLLMNETFNNT